MKKTKKTKKHFSPVVKKGGKTRFAENMIPIWVTLVFTGILIILGFLGKYIANFGTIIWDFVRKYQSEIILVLVTWTLACIFCTVFEMYRDKKYESKARGERAKKMEEENEENEEDEEDEEDEEEE